MRSRDGNLIRLLRRSGLSRVFDSPTSKSPRMEFDGRTRRYILDLPPHYDPAKPTALFMVLHGATQSAASAERMSHMSELSDQHGFIAVYPSGTGPNSEDSIPTAPTL